MSTAAFQAMVATFMDPKPAPDRRGRPRNDGSDSELRKAWPREHTELLVREYAKIGPQGVAAQTGRTPRQCSRKAHELGVRYTKKRGPRVTKAKHAFGITERELTTIKLLAQGLQVPEIAEHLHRSKDAIADRVRSIRRKMSCKTHAHIVFKAERAGMLKDLVV